MEVGRTPWNGGALPSRKMSRETWMRMGKESAWLVLCPSLVLGFREFRLTMTEFEYSLPQMYALCPDE